MSASSAVDPRIAPQISSPPIVGTFFFPVAASARSCVSLSPVSPIFLRRSQRITGLPNTTTRKNASAAASSARNVS